MALGYGTINVNGVTIPDYAAVRANSTMVPGAGWIPNDRIQTDSRGSWIGAPSATSVSGVDGSKWDTGGGMTSTPAPITGLPMQSNTYQGPSGVSMSGYSQSPYMQQMAGDITQQFNQNLMQNILPAERRSADMVGGVGGSRQGIREGQAIGQSNTGLAQALTGMYNQDYQADRTRALQKYGMDQNFALGADQLRLGFQNSANQFNLGNQGQIFGHYNANRGMDQDQQRIGLSAYGLGQQSEWSGLQNANQVFSPWGSNGGTSTSSSNSGGGLGGAIGGLLGGAQLGRNFGWW
jgi:hypothetical protein